MSECVVRMEMPKTCKECPLHEFGGICRLANDFKQIDVFVIDKGRPENCPIIYQLPEGHGRLVDARAFIELVYDEWQKGVISNSEWCDIRQWVNDAPTIVPAERSEHEN